MKKLIIIFLFSFIASYSFAQYPTPYQNLGSQNIAVNNNGGLFVNGTITPPKYADTIAANAAPNTRLYPGSLIYTTNDNIFWVRNSTATRWINFATSNAQDSIIYTEIPIAVKIDSLGRKIIYFLKERGLISGGLVTLDSCNTLDVNPTVFFLNYKQYSVPQTTGIVVPPADLSFGRIDRIIIDTNLVVRDLPGMPSATPIPPNINIFSQFELAQIQVPQNATCLTIGQRIIYDQNTGSEWTISTSGTITELPNNTDNPYHLTKAIFIPSYHNGSAITFTDGGLDTVTAGDIVKLFLYSNGAFLNQISGTWFDGATAVSNTISLNQFFNANDSNQYQNISAQLSAWNFSNTEYNKLVLTFGGDDTSGAKGLYLDYIQIQKGLNNNTSGDFVDSVKTSSDSLYYYKHGLAIYGGSVGGGGGSVTADNGLTVNTGSNVQLGGSLTHSTNIELGDNQFQMNYDGTALFLLNPFDDNEEAYIYALDPAGFGNYSKFNVSATHINAHYKNAATFGDGLKEAKIEADATASLSTLIYVADTHTVTGNLFLNTVSSGAPTDSILTINASTGQVNKINASSLVGNETLQQAADASISVSANPVINYHNGNFTLDSTSYSQTSYGGPTTAVIGNIGGAISLQVDLPIGTRRTSISMSANDITIDPRAIGTVGFIKLPSVVYNNADSLDLVALDTLTFNLYRKRIAASSGSTNSNIGSGFRLAVPNTNNIKTLFNGYAIGIDSSSNTNALTLKADSSLLLTKLRATSLYQLILSGTGYSKFSGQSVSYVSTIPIADGGTNNGSLSVTAGTIYYGDGTKLIGLAPGTTNQVLHSGATPVWKDTIGSIGNLRYSHTIFTPTTGQTITSINNQYNIVNPAGALLALTINLPSTPSNNDVVYLKFTQTITTVTYANGTVVDGIAGPAAGGLVVLTYDSGTTSWY